MFPIPRRKIRIFSPHSPEVVAERLRAHTSPRWPWFGSPAPQVDFVGSVSPIAFRLLPTLRGRNTYQPWVRGHILPSPNGTEIRIGQRLHPIGIAIILIVLIAAFVLARRLGDYRDVLAGLFVIHCVLYFAGFWSQARRAEARIRQLVA